MFKDDSIVTEGTREFERVMQNESIKKYYGDSQEVHARAMKKLKAALENSPGLRRQLDFFLDKTSLPLPSNNNMIR